MTDPYCCSLQAKALSVRCKPACFLLLFPDRAFACPFDLTRHPRALQVVGLHVKNMSKMTNENKTKEEEKMKGNDRGGKEAQQKEK